MSMVTTIPRQFRWAWLAVLGLALATRLIGLPWAPPTLSEVDLALGSLDAARGQGWPAISDSPLLLVGNAFLFSLFGPGDGIARLLPALAGVALVMLPLLWRRVLGEVGAFAASGLLLISPLALFAARRVDGAAPAVLAGGLIATLLWMRPDADEAPARNGMWLWAVAIPLGLLGGLAFYDLLLTGVVVWVWLRRPGMARPEDRGWVRPVLVGAGVALLISIAFGFRWSGWAGVVDSAAAWLSAWGGAPASGATPLALLALYEPFALLLLLIGIALLIGQAAERAPVFWCLTLWALLLIVLNSLRPGSTPASVSAVSLPLALLGGYSLRVLLDGVPAVEGPGLRMHGGVAFVFWLPALLALAQLAANRGGSDPLGLVLLGVVVLIALQVLLGMLAAARWSLGIAWRSALLGGAGALLLLQVSFALGLAFVRPASPVEPAIDVVSSPDLRHLSDVLADIAVLHEARHDALNIAVVDQDPDLTSLVRWTLRDFEEVRRVAGWPQDDAAVVITPETAEGLAPVTPDAWVGTRFVALTREGTPLPRCSLNPFACSEVVRRVLYRTAAAPPISTGVVLWQTRDIAG